MEVSQLAIVFTDTELVNDRLVNPKLILDLPISPGPFHNGGKIRIGPDNNVYIIIGDLFSVRGQRIAQYKELKTSKMEKSQMELGAYLG